MQRANVMTPMPTDTQAHPQKIRVLILEDSPVDAELMIRELRHAQFEVEWQRVQTESAFLAALDPAPDLILADYNLPQFDGISAVKLLRNRGLDIPFILISGALPEQEAVSAIIKHGADDYLTKDRLARLGSAVSNALDSKRLRDEHQQIAATLRASEERWRFALEGAGDGVWDWDVPTNEMLFSKRWKEMLGFAEDEIGTGFDQFEKLCHPQDLPQVMAEMQACFDGKIPAFMVEMRMLCKDGSWKWILTRGMVLRRDAAGKPLRVIGTHADITERKRAQDEILRLNASLEERVQQRTEELNEREMMSRSLTEGIAEGVITSTTEDIVLEANAAALRLFGYEKSDLIGRDVAELVPERHRRKYKDTTAALAAQPEGFRTVGREVRSLRKDGSEFMASVSFSDVQVGGRRLFTALILDITERKRAQDEILRLNASLEERVQQRTEELEEKNKKNKQLQALSEELQSQQEELRQSNEELEEKNQLLAEQKVEVEHKNRAIEAAKLTLEEKAEQLALTSKYKSEFLSNMSHELRTPLNSLLLLAQLLAENPENNLSEQQIECAKIIQGAGKDLLALINDILDLSKIESGTVTPDLDDVSFANVREQVERAFRHVAQSRSLGLVVELAPSLPPSLYTDSQRLQQVLKNLLSNAFKFTQKGQVSVRIAAVESGWSVDHAGLNRAQTVLGFFVTDSGIGLPADKQKIIFEAFQQADTGTARKYGGTGLGLSISREIARLLGGELHLVESSPGKGSTFALYLPLRAPEPGQGRTS